MKAAKIVACSVSIVLLFILPAKARQQVELKIDEIPVKLRDEHYGFGPRFGVIILPTQLRGRYQFLRDSDSADPGFDFVLAASKGYVARLKAFLESGGDVNVRNEEGRTALMAASSGGRFDIVRLLLSRGANPNLEDQNGDTALKAATMADFVDITPAGQASAENIEIVKLLLASGADVNAPKSWPALVCAAETGNNEVVKLLLDKGADINARSVRGMSVLSRSIYDRKLATARLLLASGADIESRDDYGYTSLMFAAQTDFDVLQNLLDKGADINARNNNLETPLMRAATVECIVALLDHGSELNAKDRAGNTALLLAVANRNSKKVLILLDRGANVNERNTDGETPLSIAKQFSDNETIIKMLVKAGANE